jgi:hypothetical protein
VCQWKGAQDLPTFGRPSFGRKESYDTAAQCHSVPRHRVDICRHALFPVLQLPAISLLRGVCGCSGAVHRGEPYLMSSLLVYWMAEQGLQFMHEHVGKIEII